MTGTGFHDHIMGLLAGLPGDLAWLVAFDVTVLREAADEEVLRAAWFLPTAAALPDGAAVVLTSAGTAVVARGDAAPLHWSGAALWPVADGTSLLDRYRDRLGHLGRNGVLCVGVGHANDGPPVAMTVERVGKAPGTEALARAAFDAPPDTHGYELLAGCGVRYGGTQPSGPFHVATFRNRISAHLTAALGSAFARTEHCNYFFFRGARLDARLQDGLIHAGEARLRVGAAIAQISAVNLALAARRTPMAMTAVPPSPEASEPMGDLVPLGLLLHALRGSGEGSPAVAAAVTLLERHLDRHREHGLWPFQSGRLITSTDSALVLLGRRDPAAIAGLEQFADGAGGYVPQHVTRDPKPGHMLLTPANRHWSHPDLGTTLVIRALRRGAGLSAATPLSFLAERFDERGALYFANPFLLDWLFAEALADDTNAADLRTRLGDEVAASVEADMDFGTWDRGLSTACAILALAALGRRGRLMRCAQLRLLDLVDATGQPEACTPFYSTLRSKPGDGGLGLIPDRPGILRVGGQRHDLTLYHDTHRMVGTALRLLALQQACDPMLLDLPDQQARADRHKRYACPDLPSYLRGYALPPYLGVPPARSAAASGTAAGGMDGLLRATYARYRPAPFVDEPSLARMLRLGRTLPGDATAFFGFECRLGGAAPEPDILVCVARDNGGPAALAAGLEAAPPSPDPFWSRLAVFCRRWADPAAPWHGLVSNIWLEFDLAGTADTAVAPVPAVFIGTDALVAGADSVRAGLVSDALDALAGAGPSPTRRAALRRVVDALPQGGSVFQLGVMLSRGDHRVRACVSGLEAAALDRYLTTLGLPDPDGSRAAVLASLHPVCAEVRAGLDATADGIGARLGIECYGGMEAGDGPRWLALLGWLQDRGLASAAEVQALLEWGGLQHSRLLRGDWPGWTDQHPARPAEGGAGALWRSLNHVKITLEPASPMAAKAYLASRLVWPTDDAVRALAAVCVAPA